ncbi:MAG: AAA domain-containing protein [Paludibacter sp.]
MNKQEKEYFHKLNKSRLELAKALKHPALVGFWNSIINKYPESAHFIYELLQNADDANASKVYFKITKDGVIFRHNGSVRFTLSEPTELKETNDRINGILGHINSITSVGASTKSAEDSENKIGKFGIGFKAVFTYTQTPHIYDETFKFKLTDYIVPSLLSQDHVLRNENETLFYLPFDKEGVNPQRSYQEIEKKLQTLDNPILFLHNIQEIIWETENNSTNGIYSKRILSTKSINGINCNLLELKNNKDEKPSKLWLFSRDVKLDEGSFPISVGYYLDEKGKRINTEIRPNIYCFFTTSENLDLCFVMHAPFLLVDNRQQIKRNEDVNFKLLYELAKLAADSILCLRDIGIKNKTYLINDNLLKIIPPNIVSTVDKLSTNIFHEKFLALLKSEKILFTQSKEYVTRDYAIWTDTPQIHKLLDSDQLNQLIIFDENHEKKKNGKYDFVFCSYYDKNEDEKGYINSKLYIEELNKEKFGKKFSYKFISSQSDEWLIKFYSFLRESKSLWERYGRYSDALLRSKPIIKLSNGEFVRPFTSDDKPNVFLPSTGLPADFNIISPLIIENQTARKFIEELGIKEPNKIDYIRKVVFPKYKDNEHSKKYDEVIEDFDIIYCQYRECTRQEQDVYINEINENFLIVGEHKADSKPHLCKIQDLYADSEELHKYFKYNKETFFVWTDYYEPVIKKYGEDKVFEFLGVLNFHTYPKIFNIYPSWNTSWNFSFESSVKKNYFSFGHYNFENVRDYNNDKKVTDYEIDGLKIIIDNTISFEISLYLWGNLTKVYRKYYKAECVYRPSYSRSLATDYCDSLIIVSLKNPNLGWLYNKDNQLKKPNEIFREDLHDNYIRNEKTQELFQLLGIESRPSTEDEKLIEKLSPEMRENYEKAKILDGMSVDDILEAKRTIEEKKAKELAYAERKRLQLEANRYNPLQKEQTKRSLDETFGDETDYQSKSKIVDQNRSDQLDKFKEKQDEELAERNHIEELKTKTEGLPKYSAEWFSTLLELEYLQSGEQKNGSKGITITFNKVEQEADASRIFVLRNPSRYIPTFLEEMGGLAITFKFKDSDDLTIGFEVANVREYTLRVKAKLADEALLNSIDLKSISRAIININNPIQLIDKLRIAFNGLGLEDSFCLKQNLPDNLHFVFGPPGTGKTTSLAKKWISAKVAGKPKVKMLILTPTNKACDVLLEKATDIVDERSNPEDWLYRFVTTSNQSLENYVCDRSFDIKQLDKICLISTIARFPYDGFQDTNYNLKLKDIDWDYIIIDEASMISLAQIIFVIYQCPRAKFIIAGDPFQIEPIVKEPIWEGENIYTLVNLKSFTSPVLEPKPFVVENLETQYRSLPAIGAVFSEYSYDGKLKHYRTEENQRPLKLNGFDIKTINYIQFKVERFDSIYGAKKLSYSNVHIYSVLLSFEFVNYLAQQITKNHVDEKYRIGIICPYKPQTELINKLWEQRIDTYENVEVQVGTIHGFQGDECDIIIAVFNPPTGLKGASDKVSVNKQNIINVAISRARDYLFILMPDKDTDSFDNLYELKRLGRISTKQRKDVASFTANDIENAIFKDKFHIENNTFVTSHQLANVYTQPTQKYEVRIDENSVDIQMNIDDMYNHIN